MMIPEILIYQYAIIAETVLFILFVLAIPKSGWARIIAKRKKTGALVTLCSDDGFEKDYVMKADAQNGIFSGRKDTLVFTPDPQFVEEEVEVVQKDGTTVLEKKPFLDLTADKKKIMDEAIQTRSFTDTGLPHFTGLLTKRIAVTPRFLELIKKINRGFKENDKVGLITLVEPHSLKSYFKGTFSQQMIENIKFAAERRGFLRKPIQDNLKKAAIPVMLILFILFVYWAISSGYIDLSGFGIGVPPIAG